jgi:hypothetical protein
MPPALRSVLAVLAGIAVFLVTAIVVEGVSAWLFPPPPGLDLSKPEDMKTLMETIPLGAKLIVMAGWVAARLAGRSPLRHAGAIGVLGVVGAVATMLMIPHPLWMWVVGLIAFPAAAYLAGLVAGRQPAPSSPKAGPSESEFAEAF